MLSALLDKHYCLRSVRSYPSESIKSKSIHIYSPVGKSHRSLIDKKRPLGRNRLDGVVHTASYPYSSGPLPSGNYAYRANDVPYAEAPASEENYSFGGILKSLRNFISFTISAITRCILRIVPEGTSAETVDVGVKVGMILGVLVFARAILSLLIAVGSVFGLIFLGTRLLIGNPKRRATPQPAPQYAPPPPAAARYQSGVYYPSAGVYYHHSYYAASSIPEPYTADVLNVYREPPFRAAYFSPHLQWPATPSGGHLQDPPPPPPQNA